MMETYMDYVSGEKFFTYGTDDPKKIARLRKRIEERPDGVEIRIDDPVHGMMVRLPTSSWNYEPKPKAKRTPADDATKERLRANLEKAQKARGLL